MEDDKNKCPLCGKDTEDSEIFCHNCREIAHNAYSDELISHQEDEVPAHENIIETDSGQDYKEVPLAAATPLVKNRKRPYMFLVLLVITLFAVATTGVYFIDWKKAALDKQEAAYWNKCIEENTPLSYSTYLLQYPAGKFKDEAEDRIRQLRSEEQQAWEAIGTSSDINALFAFLSDHPTTPYERHIRYRIDSLAWVKTAAENTAATYLAYIENVKIGQYSGEYIEPAQQKYDYLSQLKAVEGNDLKEITGILSNFLDALAATDSKDMQKYSDVSFEHFLGASGKNCKEVSDSLKADRKKKKIRKLSYSFHGTPEVIQDNKGIYFVSLPVVEETTYSDRRKKKENSHRKLRVEMNDKKLVKAVYINTVNSNQ
ncbi:zinc ribbon domain-containing protein [Dysgonomonas sp. 511]|uniref:zinc ribbon domain-containing protein n=1 Tax=Dysgonomonas sp. 511 TaxID=2302930 RepID=UPI0013D878F5|nr:zinc ribbon domain-containing protein [Dysgonomonas sp. 511]NDV79242.1 zinc ribbon domain-containing protein [Dysgonomonas sp. 511]